MGQSRHRASKDRTCSHYLSAYHHEGEYLNFGLGACARCIATSGHMRMPHHDKYRPEVTQAQGRTHVGKHVDC